MKNLNWLFLITLFVCNVSLGQTTSENNNDIVRLSGVVLDIETTTPLVGVNVRRGNVVTATDIQGRFAMNVYVQDTIHFTYVGYRNYDLEIPDSLSSNEYMMAIFMTMDTLVLPEVIVVSRYVDRDRIYRMNAQSNMANVRRDAFSPASQLTPQQNEKRILDQYAASTNKGHVNVDVGVGIESWRTFRQLQRAHRISNEPPELMSLEEIDLIKLLFGYQRLPEGDVLE